MPQWQHQHVIVHGLHTDENSFLDSDFLYVCQSSATEEYLKLFSGSMPNLSGKMTGYVPCSLCAMKPLSLCFLLVALLRCT